MYLPFSRDFQENTIIDEKCHHGNNIVTQTEDFQIRSQNNEQQHRSRVMSKPTFSIGETKGADQLRSNCEADQRLCFRYTASTVPLLFKSTISIL